MHRTSECIHCDFLLEEAEALAAFRLPQPLDQLVLGQEIVVPRLPDHRKMYLTYEGEISRGRGIVSRYESGTYEILSEEGDIRRLQLTGQRFRRDLQLRRLGEQEYGLTPLPREE